MLVSGEGCDEIMLFSSGAAESPSALTRNDLFSRLIDRIISHLMYGYIFLVETMIRGILG